MRQSIIILNDLRKQKNIPTITLEAKMIGISRKQWTLIINDKIKDPRTSTTLKIAGWLGRHVDEIFLLREFA